MARKLVTRTHMLAQGPGLASCRPGVSDRLSTEVVPVGTPRTGSALRRFVVRPSGGQREFNVKFEVALLGNHDPVRPLSLLIEDRPFRRFVFARTLMLVTALSPPFVVALSATIESSAVLRWFGRSDWRLPRPQARRARLKVLARAHGIPLSHRCPCRYPNGPHDIHS